MSKISKNPVAVWLGGWDANVANTVASTIQSAKNTNTVPLFVAYNIPGRDCSQYSAGGATDDASYDVWIQSIAGALGNNKAVVILEPDSVALTTCLSSSQIQDRYALLQNAVNVLKSKPSVSVYIDAGHPDWISASDMANRLKQVGIAQADGFALNVSNFYTTADNESYGASLSALVGGKHFVIDTSRNGLGGTPDNQWCNPPGRGLGYRPTTTTGNPLVDAYLWIKTPGESDGACNGGPSAGVWWPSYALGLADNSQF